MNTHELQRVPLDSRAADYIRKKLKRGRSFARLLSVRDELVRGMTSTYVPSDARVAVYSFEKGIFPESAVTSRTPRGTWIRKPNADTTLASLLIEFLARSEAHVVIFEEYILTANDLRSGGIETTTVTCGDEVYHVLVHDDVHDENAVKATIKRARSWQFLGAMSSVSSSSILSPGADIKEEVLQDLAKEATVLIVGAYDGESFLMSRRS